MAMAHPRWANYSPSLLGVLRGARLSSLTDTRQWGQVGAYAVRFVVVALAYYVTARLSLRVALVGSVVTPLWPPTGIAVVALLSFGVRLWPAITLAALLVNVPINQSFGAAMLIAVGNTAAPLLAVGLLHAAGFRSDLDRLRDALSLVLLGALTSMALSAGLGTAALLMDGTISRSEVASTWALWWAGDATGVLVFAPLLLSVRRVRQLSWRRWIEATVVITGLAFVAYLVFHSQYADTYLVFPLLILAAVRFGQLGASLAAVTVVGITVWSAIDEVGPFAHTTLLHRMLMLQTYDAVIALTSFVLAAIMTERVGALAREHRNAETLQRSLLPDRLPIVPGVEFASRYLPGSAGLEVGGDWYDVFTLPHGRLGLTIGDVVGRGLAAAATMGQLRTALRAYAIETNSPAEVVQRLSQLAAEFETAQMATLTYAVLDPDSRNLSFASAGHPPPLLIGPNRLASYLMEGRSAPLGVTKSAQAEATVTLRPGSTLVLYTDGLIESRRGSIDKSMEALRTAVEGYHGDLDSLCDDRVLQPPRPESSGDDVALLMVRLLPVPARDLQLVRPAEPRALATEPVSESAPNRVSESRVRVQVTRPTDDIDLDNAATLYRDLLDGMSHDAVGLVVDLSELRHIDTAGIRMLHRLAECLAQRRQQLRVVVPDDSSFRRVLALSCFDAHLPLTSTVGSAVSEIGCAGGGLSASDLVVE